jgi:hypothetical protein
MHIPTYVQITPPVPKFQIPKAQKDDRFEVFMAVPA